MESEIQISVVIPTRNRKARLMALLKNLALSSFPISEVVIVDASDESIDSRAFDTVSQLSIVYLRSTSSVCVQRNKGIEAASSPWIFICDDDVEVPPDYLQKLSKHIHENALCGAVSGLFLQKHNGQWVGNYPLSSNKELLLKYIFKLSIWGEVNYDGKNRFLSRIKRYYEQKGNHISAAGWPIITNFKNTFVDVPVYTLGAALVRKEWLLNSMFDEVLDKHGIGENYGVCIGFPAPLQLLNSAFVYHHHEAINRLVKPLQYYRRVLALDYFIQTKAALKHVKRRWLLWSLFGNLLIFMFEKDTLMSKAAFKTFWRTLVKTNPYLKAYQNGEKVTEPVL